MITRIKICDTVIEAEHMYAYFQRLCEAYLTEEAPCFSVSVTPEELAEQKAKSKENFPDSVYEATCLHRAIVKGMVKYGVLLIHSAVVAVDGEAYAFLARSGVGKSTHVRQWLAHFGDRARVVNGDKPMYSFRGERLYVYGSPWRGKEGWGENIAMPLRAFCLLERGTVNAIAPADGGEILKKLFAQVLIPTEEADVAVFMQMLDRMVKEVPFYRLQCTISEEAAVVAYEGMTKEGIS